MMLFALVYLWPALLGGKILSPNSVLFALAPWRNVAPADFQHTWNPLLTDIPAAYYPWNVFARNLIHAGVFPAWNPDAYSGTPFFANAQTGILSVLNLPLWVLSLNYGIAVSAWLKLWLGGLGVYLLVRELRLGFWPGMLAGASFLLCAFNVAWITYETLPATAAMMPWALWLGERIVLRRRLGDAVWLAVVTAVAITAGQPEIAVQVLIAASLYIALRLLTIQGQRSRERIEGIVLAMAGLTFGVLLSAIVLFPVLQAGLGTPGAAYRTGGTFLIPWSALKTALFPGWWSTRTLPLAGPVNFNVRTFYVGAAALILACTGLISRGRWREKLPLVTLAVIGIAIAFGVPGVRWVGSNVPPLNRTKPAYILLWFELAVPILGAFGLDALMEAPRRQLAVWTVLIVAVAAAVVAVVSVGPSLHELRTTINHLRTGRSYTDPKIIALTSIGWWVIFTMLVAGVLVLMRFTGRTHWIGVAMVLIVAVDLLHFSHGYQPMLSPKESSPPRTPAVAYLQRHSGSTRIVGLGPTLDEDYDMVYGLRDARGYDPPQPSYRYLRLWQLANPTQIAVDPFQVGVPTPVGLRVMSLLGVRYLVEDPSEAPVVALRKSVVYRGSDAVIYENPSSVPPAVIAHRIIAVSGEHAALVRVASKNFDPSTEVIVEGNQVGAREVPAASAGGTVSVMSESNSTVSLVAHLRQAGVVMLDDAIASGWTVTVDGQTRPALRVDDVMRGVNVSAGRHIIVWRYSVPRFRLGAIVSGLSALILLLVGGLATRRRLVRRSLC
jgi:Bacterial membrane protein YfhO